MLNLLKRDLVAKENATSVPNIIMESLGNDDIRDAFLDDVDLVLLGSENDSKVEQEIAAIPEFNENELTSEELHQLENLEESVATIPDFDIEE